MQRRSSTRARLERLEKAVGKNGTGSDGTAIIEMGPWTDGERHIVVDPVYGHFREVAGPGPQLSDFGDFSPVVYMTSAEMEIPCDERPDLFPPEPGQYLVGEHAKDCCTIPASHTPSRQTGFADEERRARRQ